MDRAIYVQNRLHTAIRRLHTWRAYLRLPRSSLCRTSAGLRWLDDVDDAEESVALMEWVLREVDPVANKRFGAAFANTAAIRPIVEAGQVCRAAGAATEAYDPFDACWSDWLKAVHDLFRRHRKELSARRSAWDAIVRETAATLRAEQQKARRFGALFRRAKPPSTAVATPRGPGLVLTAPAARGDLLVALPRGCVLGPGVGQPGLAQGPADPGPRGRGAPGELCLSF